MLYWYNSLKFKNIDTVNIYKIRLKNKEKDKYKTKNMIKK